MQFYAQIDPRWSGIPLGNTQYHVGDSGCYVMAAINVARSFGWDVDPVDVFNRMNSVGGYNEAGLAIHAKIEEVLPMLHYGGTDGYIVYGEWKTKNGTFGHAVAQVQGGEVIDSFHGTDGFPGGFTESLRQGLGVDRVPAPTPPAEESKPAPAELPTYTVVEGDTLGDIVLSHYGEVELWGTEGAVAVVAKFNNIEDPNVIQPGQVITFPNL